MDACGMVEGGLWIHAGGLVPHDWAHGGYWGRIGAGLYLRGSSHLASNYLEPRFAAGLWWGPVREPYDACRLCFRYLVGMHSCSLYALLP